VYLVLDDDPGVLTRKKSILEQGHLPAIAKYEAYSSFSSSSYYYCYYYAAFNAPCVAHTDDESHARNLLLQRYVRGGDATGCQIALDTCCAAAG